MSRVCFSFALIVAFALPFAYTSYAQDEIENILENGDFEADRNVAEGWNTYGPAAMTVVDETRGAEVDEPIPQGKYALEVEVQQKGANFWNAGLQHQNHVFEKGKMYTLSAWLKAEEGNMEINFKPELGVDPWTGYGEKRFVFTNTWEEYWTSTPEMPADVNPATITFHIAFAPGVFWIDNVRFYEGEYVPSNLDGQPQAVQPAAKLTTLWAQVKSQ